MKSEIMNFIKENVKNVIICLIAEDAGPEPFL